MIATRLKAAREARGLTQYQAAVAAGCLPWTWSRWEREAQDLRITSLIQAAKALGTTGAALLEGIQ